MKARQRPKWSLLFSHLKSGVVGIKYTDKIGNERDSKLTLVTAFIPSKLHKEQAPNNPLNQEQMTAFDLDVRQWVTFDLETIEDYQGLLSYEYSGNRDVRERPNTFGEASANEGKKETSDATKFRSRFDPQKG